MKRILQTTAIAAATLSIPAFAAAQSYNQGYNTYSPHQACKKKEDKKQILGGLLGAVAGGVLGSQVSGNGARTEGSAIGAVVGGLAGAGIADKTIDCDPAYPVNAYGTETYQPTSYGQSPGYYQDRVTYSNHPVYSDPTYGAGAVNQGTTYNAGTVTYPPQTYSGQTYQQAPVYTQPSYSQPVYTQTSYSQGGYSQPSYNTYGATHSSGYITRDPYYRPKPVRGARHFHGSFECNGIH